MRCKRWMKLDASLEIEAEVVEQQRLLNGAEYLTLEGEGVLTSPLAAEDRHALSPGMAESADEAWSFTLSFERRKETGAALTDGDLTLTASLGTLFGELEAGRTGAVVDELAGDERTTLELAFQIRGGEGHFDRSNGVVRVEGEIVGTTATLQLTLAVET